MTPKVIITGTGRAGTSYLMRLLTRLGFNTGYVVDNDGFVPAIRAGCEWLDCNVLPSDPLEVRKLATTWPQVIKGPDIVWHLKRLIQSKAIDVDHVVIPVRDLEDATRSRLSVGLDWMIDPKSTDKTADQLKVNCEALGRAVEACVVTGTPYTLMRYPDFTTDLAYLKGMLSVAFPSLIRGVSVTRFHDVMESLRREEQP